MNGLQTPDSGKFLKPRLLVLAVLAALAEGDAASDGGVAPVRADRGGGLTGVVTETEQEVTDFKVAHPCGGPQDLYCYL